MEQHAIWSALEAGEQARREARWGDADAALRQALQAARLPTERARVLEAMVHLGLDTGDDLAAEAWLAEAERLHAEEEGPFGPGAGRCLALQARLRMLAYGDAHGACAAWERAVRLLDGEARRDALRGLGLARLELGELDAAERSLEQALDGSEGWARAEALEGLARLRTAQGQHERALLHVHERVGLVHELAGPWTLEAANTLLLLAATCEAQGDLEAAAGAMDGAVGALARVLGQDDPETMMAAAYLLALRSRLAGAPPVPDEDGPDQDGPDEDGPEEGGPAPDEPA